MKKIILSLFLLVCTVSFAKEKTFYGQYRGSYIPTGKDFEKYETQLDIKAVYYTISLSKNNSKHIRLNLTKVIKTDKEYVQMYTYEDLIMRKERNRYKLYNASTGALIASIKGSKITYLTDGYTDLILSNK